ncbi:Fmp52p SCDLUD_005168 [Saccharomycodes ludwigii]|uniref:Fmp52p n=1 Tax=Saccharomycodes ludwigii TaxID=36035 RepID=UPI001E893F54|nr:hypothetical protein SCDLUD_005168 [Saccharomycodes ludwigii]KAH3898830.1 hypothetical protein SCDLUD_005168 [Saccharomycodes ludwigii]
MNALIIGATGLCGSGFLKYAKQSGKFQKIYTITRKELPLAATTTTASVDSSAIESVVEKDSSLWKNRVPEDVHIMFSALGTTRADANGLENQIKIDHDLNLELAEAAKKNGCKVYVLVSSIGADSNSRFGYSKMKGDIEKDVIALGFDKTIILRPGILLGDRSTSHKGFGNDIAVKVCGFFYRTPLQRFFINPIYGDEVAKVGVKLALDDSVTDKVKILESDEILKLSGGV